MTKSIKIDLKDRKILSELDWNARLSNAEIGRRVGLSKKGVEYRIKRLERLGVIEGYYPVINFMKLGYHIIRVEVNLQYLTDDVRKKLEQHIKNKNGINWAIWMKGKCDLAFDIWSKGFSYPKRSFYDLNMAFEEYINNRQTSTSIAIEHFPYDFLIGKRSKEIINISETSKIKDIDSLDKKILETLCENARQSLTDVSTQLNKNLLTIKSRLNRLKKEEILLGARASINLEKLGYGHYKILLYLSNHSEETMRKIDSFFRKDVRTTYIVNHFGSDDFDVELVFESDKEFFSFIDELHNNFPRIIKSYEFMKFEKTIKINYLPSDL